MTTKELITELRLTERQIKYMMQKSADGTFDYGGRRFRFGKDGNRRVFTEVARPAAAASAGGDDLAGMGSAELKEEKQRLECRLLRQRLKEEGEELKMQGAAAVTAEYQRRLDRLHDALAEVVHAPEDLARLRRLIKEIRD